MGSLTEVAAGHVRPLAGRPAQPFPKSRSTNSATARQLNAWRSLSS